MSHAIDRLSNVARQYDAGVFEPSTRVTKLLGIKQYQESEDMHILYDFGSHFRTLKTVFAGDLRQKLIVAGGVANSGDCNLKIFAV